MDGMFIGMGILFLVWGATDLIFPIAEITKVAVFGLMRLMLSVVSMSIGIGVEAHAWTKIGNEKNA